jgi:Nucleotidyl transferase AbiEii toxin, Type IV TA system
MSTAKNVAASVRARLLNRAKEQDMDYNLILTRYALERLLYRLSVSPWAEGFLLKGALLFELWFDQPHRPTRDMDLLGFGSSDVAGLVTVFSTVCALPHEDGIVFDPATVRASEIRKEANYAGVRITLMGLLDGARCAVQIDVGYGDAVTPDPERVSYPVLLSGMLAPQIRAYPRYTVVAEKYQAMVSLGMVNTRLKDYFDVWFLTQRAPLDPAVLLQAIAATFARRGTPLPLSLPMGLSDMFAKDPSKQKQWAAFLQKNKLQAPQLDTLVSDLRAALWL